MEPVTRDFAELSAAERPLAGGKGGTLARLFQAGFPVPEGFVIFPSAFHGHRLRPEAWEEVRRRWQRLRSMIEGSFAVAVRSSALGEDSLQASFAGELETVLDVRTETELRDAIEKVRRSASSERVAQYANATGATAAWGGADAATAVVVQRMLAASLSGVLFTADPVSGTRNRMVGNVVTGLCDKLVSGAANGRAFSISHDGTGYGGPDELELLAGRLHRLGQQLEAELGGPQDVEWAVVGPTGSNGSLHLLQSRPVTTLQEYRPATGEWNATFAGDYLWTNVNFGEAVPGVMTPLTWTVLHLIIGQWTVLPGHDLCGNIGGRPYLNVSLPASLFKALHKGRDQLLATLEGTLFMQLPETLEIPLVPLSRWAALSATAGVIRNQLRFRIGERKLPAYLLANPGWCERARQRIRAVGSASELRSLWEHEIGPHVMASLWMVLGGANGSAEHTMALRRDLIEWVGPDDASVLISNLGGRSTGEGRSGLLASLGPVIGLSKVARGQMTRETYLQRYGHRGPHEFELSVPRPAEDPRWLDQQLAQLSSSQVDAEGLLERRGEAFRAALGRLQALQPRRAAAIARRIEKAAHRGRLREEARSEYVRERWVVRSFALRAGELTGVGDDVFFLTLDEVLGALAGETAAQRYLAARKATHARARALPPYPSLISGRFDPWRWANDPRRRPDFFDARATPEISASPSSALVRGCAGSSGRVEGVVRCLSSPERGQELLPGEILVAPLTDIAWTVLFPRAAAVVTDVGAPLSHAAIVARELGIPAVVGCGDATNRLRTGDRVRVDGGQGTVELLSRATFG